jgi:hypothetical protein
MLFSYIMDNDKIDDDKQMPLHVARFEGLADAPEQYRWHHMMQHVQGLSGSHWTPASGNYSLLIAPAAARATATQTAIHKCT